MPAPTNGVPTAIEAGNSYAFLLSYGDFPVADYSLEFCLQSGNSSPKIIQATVSGTQFLVTLTTAVTALFPTGSANYGCYAKGLGTRYTAESGIVQVSCNLEKAKAKSFAQQQLEHWQSEYAKMDRQLQSASSVIQSTKFSPAKIWDEMKKWEAVVDVERRRELVARVLPPYRFGGTVQRE